MVESDSTGDKINKVRKTTSLIWATVIALPMLAFGAGASMALAHSGGPILVLFLPVFPALLLFGDSGPLSSAPEWLFMATAALSQVGAMFLLIHGVRLWRARRGDA